LSGVAELSTEGFPKKRIGPSPFALLRYLVDSDLLTIQEIFVDFFKLISRWPQAQLFNTLRSAGQQREKRLYSIDHRAGFYAARRFSYRAPGGILAPVAV